MRDDRGALLATLVYCLDNFDARKTRTKGMSDGEKKMQGRASLLFCLVSISSLSEYYLFYCLSVPHPALLELRKFCLSLKNMVFNGFSGSIDMGGGKVSFLAR